MGLFGSIGKGITNVVKNVAKLGGAAEARPVAELPYLQQQQALINQLQARAMGQAPSITDAQAQAALQKSLANTVSALGSEAGINPAQRAALASQAQAQAQGDIAQQAMMARLAEQQQAEEALAGTISSAQGAAMGREQQISQNYNQMMANRAAMFANLAQGAQKAASGGATGGK